MSWQDRIDNTKFSITTGDGKVYFPLWKTAEKSKEYNTSKFDFIRVSGSLIERKLPQAANYPLTFYFDGADCIEKSEAFERSADDSRVWTVVHPFYGTIKGQPISISRKDDNLNITEITVDFWESIDVDYPNANFSVKDNTLERKNKVLEALIFSAEKPVYQTADIQKLKTQNINNQSSFTNVVSEPISIADGLNENYQNAINLALKSSDLLLSDTFEAIRTSQDLLNLPSRIETSIDIRLGAYKLAFSKAKEVLNTVADKLRFESNAGAILANYADASVNPSESDYVVVTQIQQVAQNLSNLYADYLHILDQNTVGIYDTDNAWQPNVTAQNNLYELITYTIANLFNLGFESQQERIVYTTKETNLILLTHQYLGLDANDENIENFRQINNIKNEELFRIKKERKIIYYV